MQPENHMDRMHSWVLICTGILYVQQLLKCILYALEYYARSVGVGTSFSPWAYLQSGLPFCHCF